jgi:hypothetical protein
MIFLPRVHPAPVAIPCIAVLGRYLAQRLRPGGTQWFYAVSRLQAVIEAKQEFEPEPDVVFARAYLSAIIDQLAMHLAPVWRV